MKTTEKNHQFITLQLLLTPGRSAKDIIEGLAKTLEINIGRPANTEGDADEFIEMSAGHICRDDGSKEVFEI